MEGFDKSCLVRHITLQPSDGVNLAISEEQIPFNQLREGDLFLLGNGDSEEVFRIRAGVTEALRWEVVRIQRPQTRYMCDNMGYGPDTGRPIFSAYSKFCMVLYSPWASKPYFR